METQSPINLTATVNSSKPLDLVFGWATPIDGFVHRGEHGTEVIFPPSDSHFIQLGERRYTLRQFHFHHPSEHLWNGKLFDAELHIVHQDLDECSFAVVAVFLTVTQGSSQKGLENFLKGLSAQSKGTVAIPTEPLHWLPDRWNRVLRYEGSLTTPPYSESVSWIAIEGERTIGADLFHEVFTPRVQSARPLQPRNRRFIVDYKAKWWWNVGVTIPRWTHSWIVRRSISKPLAIWPIVDNGMLRSFVWTNSRRSG